VTPRPPAGPATAEALLEALLDAEAPEAMGQAEALVRVGQAEAVLRTLAEAAIRNDPSFNHAHQSLAVAAAADLAPTLPASVRAAMLIALAKNLANSQGSGDLGHRAETALAQA
jgi:hypothetical protein